MAKSVQTVKNSLKFKANVRSGVLSVRVGMKKHKLPLQVRMLTDDKYIFLSFPASSELYRIEGKELVAMGVQEDATEAFTALNPGKRGGRKRASALPESVAMALAKIPSGYRVGYDADGNARLVRTRKRRA